MASLSSKSSETFPRDETACSEQQNCDEKSSKNSKTFEEGNALRKKIRQFRREDERQTKSLTKDLRDIRESLAGVTNLHQTGKRDGIEFEARKGQRSCKKIDSSSAPAQGKAYKVKVKEGRHGISSKRGKHSPQKVCADGSTVPCSRPGKAARPKANETILSLSSIDLQ